MIEILNEETVTHAKDTTSILPKNIRQIGDTRDDIKVYIEDYVMTYIKQLAAYDDEQEEAVVLYGSRQQIDETCYYFINGAVKVPKVNSPLQNTLFDQEDWTKINGDAARFFPNLSVLGWALLGMDEENSSGYRVKATQEEFFGEQQPVFVEYLKSEREEKVYLYHNGMMKRQGGHYIYYDRNEPMQNYMINQKEVMQQSDDEHLDHATRQFRMVVKEKKEQKKKQRVNVLLYSTAIVLALVVILTGFTLLNNYEKMQSMEKVLFRIADETGAQEAESDADDLDKQLQLAGSGELGQDLVDITDAGKGADAEGDAVQTASVIEAADGREQTQADGEKETAGGAAGTDESPLSPDGQAGTGEDAQADTAKEAAQSGDVQTDTGVAAAQTSDGAATTGEDVQADSPAADGQSDQAENVTGQPEAAAGTDAEETSVQPKYLTYKIKKGDTLQKINYAFYGNKNRIAEICQINHIEDKDNIKYGVNILLPQ